MIGEILSGYFLLTVGYVLTVTLIEVLAERDNLFFVGHICEIVQHSLLWFDKTMSLGGLMFAVFVFLVTCLISLVFAALWPAHLFCMVMYLPMKALKWVLLDIEITFRRKKS